MISLCTLPILPGIQHQEWLECCDVWDKSDNIRLDMSAVSTLSDINHIFHLASRTAIRALSLCVFSELAEHPNTPDDIFQSLFILGDKGCQESIALRESLSPSLLKKCLSADIIHPPRFAFLKLMQFPSEWLTLDMYPMVLFSEQMRIYEKGDEEGSEHYRYGAFHWWLKNHPTAIQLSNLLQLTYLDKDELMAGDARSHIINAIKELHNG